MDSPPQPGLSRGRFFIAGLLVAALLLGFLPLWAVYRLHAQVQLSRPVVYVTIPKGSHARSISKQLREAGLELDENWFILFSCLRRSSNRLKSGEYLFEEGVTLFEVLKKIEEGHCLTVKVTFPEGFRTSQIAERLAQAAVIQNEESFMKWTVDEPFVRSLGIDGSGARGFLYPDSFLFSRGLDERDVIAIMVQRFHEVLPQDFAERAQALGLDPYEAVTLASIVEKEAVVDEERRIISAVFHNRLRKGWPLQSDPCVRFATKNFGRHLTYKDLKHDSPYNTYVYKGLPPGPICNPGLPSLLAAVTPMDVGYLFFVSMNNGRHHFSENLEDHNKAVWRYQIMNEVGT